MVSIGETAVDFLGFGSCERAERGRSEVRDSVTTVFQPDAIGCITRQSKAKKLVSLEEGCMQFEGCPVEAGGWVTGK